MLHTQIENEQNCWTMFTSVYNSVSMVWPTKYHKKNINKESHKGAENEVKSFQKKFHSKCVCVCVFFFSSVGQKRCTAFTTGSLLEDWISLVKWKNRNKQTNEKKTNNELVLPISKISELIIWC